jgi:mRNA interferase MazF
MLSILCPVGESNKRFSIYSMRTKPGEVWLADLGIAEKTRPILVVSREDSDPTRALVIQVPLTTKNRFSRYEVDLGKLPFLREASVANVQGLTSIPVVRLQRSLGEVSVEMLAQVKEALRFALDF